MHVTGVAHKTRLLHAGKDYRHARTNRVHQHSRRWRREARAVSWRRFDDERMAAICLARKPRSTASASG